MSHFNPNQHFDVENWREQKIAQRTKDALAARDAAFAEKHAGTPLRELALYLARCARTLRHSPAPCEVDGGAFIEQRFGSWDAALRAACLPPARTMKLNSTARYRKERAIQEPLFLAERKEKKRQELICKGWFLPPNTYDCGSFVVNRKAVVGKESKNLITVENST